ncbi:GPO family capsid scaffolding protein [Glaciimonas sp. Gout2]|uniref:GPO family capsid scaffolding protein n=1 Tax=unclassified Glaciimonas TaxID=2644401 RepID=UPI002B2392B0|nr:MULTISPECIES: GPO family capsid scaffolding protein [unclassified Glaciimonas]MEB0011847.1 GPO family capsid scaffolding protein [Glaciimonas sp. Cout2]MEB0080597.1 GPO family capsid scaffolding protein [Glaciimonas sp. Gout2]
MSTKSKFFRVALEGATTDGRKIDRKAIEQIARNFNRDTYGARVWLEHKRSLLPDSPFKAYGDVLAVKADEVETDSGTKLALFAQVSPTPSLIAMNRDRQKIYTSIELNPDFSDTKQAYLVGLGVTDSPASLGTEILTFAANSNVNLFMARKQHAHNLFSEAIEAEMEFEDDSAPELTNSKFTTTIKNIMKRFAHKESGDDARFNDVSEALEAVALHASDTAQSFTTQFAAAEKKIAALQDELAVVTTELATFKQQMDTQDGNPSKRPPATGGSGMEQTEF